MTRKEMNIEYDNLKGNINRMCVTDNLSEMIDMYEYAQKRLDKIYQYNKNRLLNKEDHELEDLIKIPDFAKENKQWAGLKISQIRN